MRCSGSPTTCTAPDIPAQPERVPQAARGVERVFEMLLLGIALKPAVKALGPFGELVVAEIARRALPAPPRR